MALQVPSLCSKVVTLITRILYTLMLRFYMLLQVVGCIGKVITLVTRVSNILDFFRFFRSKVSLIL